MLFVLQYQGNMKIDILMVYLMYIKAGGAEYHNIQTHLASTLYYLCHGRGEKFCKIMTKNVGLNVKLNKDIFLIVHWFPSQVDMYLKYQLRI